MGQGDTDVIAARISKAVTKTGNQDLGELLQISTT